jgi:hypothetical protein
LKGNDGIERLEHDGIDVLDSDAGDVIVDDSLSDTDNNSTVTFEFSENVTGFDANDVTVSGGLLSSFMSIDANSFSATFTADDGIETTGSVSVGTGYTDQAGNSGTAGSDNVSIDTLNPTVVSIDRADGSPTDADSLNFTVTFNESVSGIDIGDFVVATTGTASANVASASASSGTSVTVTVDNITGDGAIGLDFDNSASAGVTDAAGNSSVGDFTGRTYTFGRKGQVDLRKVKRRCSTAGGKYVRLQCHLRKRQTRWRRT